MLKIASYNVNGIRAAIKKGLLSWLEKEQFDIICFQETKSQPDQVDNQLFIDLGYHAYWHSAEKKGYSGVLTLSKMKADLVLPGTSIQDYDREGRILRTDFKQWTLLNCYYPSGTSSDDRHNFKMKFLSDFGNWVSELKKERSQLIVVGDYNIVHETLDIHNPKRKDNPSGYRPEERKWLSDWFNNGFVDAFRYIHPEQIEFSWWSYRAGSRGKNLGWRIDYISVSNELINTIHSAGHKLDAFHSDHCPVWVELDL